MQRAASFLHTLLCLILLNLIFFAATPNAHAGDTIRINGSGSSLEMMKPLMEAYGRSSQDVFFTMGRPLGSSGAIKALLAGVIDIAVASRALKPEEIAQGAKVKHFGKTPLAIVTKKNISIKTISTKELEDIYSGEKRKWSNGETIRVILRPNEDTDTKILKGLSPGMAEAVAKAHRRQGMILAVTDPESNETVSRTSGSIGTAGLTGILFGEVPLKVIALNGVMPNIKTLADGTYPLAKSINFVTTGKLPYAAAKFIDFIYSKKGRAIAEKIGVLITADSK
jgi:phosphate transport system substrate-binding protein